MLPRRERERAPRYGARPAGEKRAEKPPPSPRNPWWVMGARCARGANRDAPFPPFFKKARVGPQLSDTRVCPAGYDQP